MHADHLTRVVKTNIGFIEDVNYEQFIVSAGYCQLYSHPKQNVKLSIIIGILRLKQTDVRTAQNNMYVLMNALATWHGR